MIDKLSSRRLPRSPQGICFILKVGEVNTYFVKTRSYKRLPRQTFVGMFGNTQPSAFIRTGLTIRKRNTTQQRTIDAGRHSSTRYDGNVRLAKRPAGRPSRRKYNQHCRTPVFSPRSPHIYIYILSGHKEVARGLLYVCGEGVKCYFPTTFEVLLKNCSVSPRSAHKQCRCRLNPLEPGSVGAAILCVSEVCQML